MPLRKAPIRNSGNDASDRPRAETAAPLAPPAAPMTKPARRPYFAMKAEIGVAVSIEAITIIEMGRVAKQALGASCLPARPAMVKIMGICAPNTACAATRTYTLRRERVSDRVVMTGIGRQGRVWFQGAKQKLKERVSVGRIIEGPDCVAEGAAWLAARVPEFAAALEEVGPLPLRRHADGFGALLDAIVGQQVSVASARAIWARLEAAGLTDPAAMAVATDEELRSVGLSRQKARYGRELARAGVDFVGLRERPDHEVVATLVAVPGIGMWTAEIYAMFALGRADVFAPGDLALQEAARVLFGLEARPGERQLRAMAEDWSPWRAVAARLLWSYYRVAKSREGIR